jgi:hypothetical protein
MFTAKLTSLLLINEYGCCIGKQYTLDRTVHCLQRRVQATCDAVVSEKLPNKHGVQYTEQILPNVQCTLYVPA